MAQPVAVQSRFEEKTEEFELLPHHEETLFYVWADTVHYGTEEQPVPLEHCRYICTSGTYVLCTCWIDYFISIIINFCVSIDEL